MGHTHTATRGQPDPTVAPAYKCPKGGSLQGLVQKRARRSRSWHQLCGSRPLPRSLCRTSGQDGAEVPLDLTDSTCDHPGWLRTQVLAQRVGYNPGYPVTGTSLICHNTGAGYLINSPRDRGNRPGSLGGLARNVAAPIRSTESSTQGIG